MPKRCQNAIRLSPSQRRLVEAEFTGAEVTSNGGAPLLAEADRRLGLTEAAARAMGDDRRRKSVAHLTLSIVRQRLFEAFGYAARSWPREWRVVAKAEHAELGPNTRFVVTNLEVGDDSQGLYDGMYCERGEMENRIKDQQLGLFTDRASSSDLHANQYRLLLSGLAYTLLEGMRRRPCRRRSWPRRRRRPSA